MDHGMHRLRSPGGTHARAVREPRRERDDQAVFARLAPIFMVGLRPVPEPGPASERAAVHPPPRSLGLDPLRIGQPIPLDARSADVVLQEFIKRLGEGSSSNSVANARLSAPTLIHSLQLARPVGWRPTYEND